MNHPCRQVVLFAALTLGACGSPAASGGATSDAAAGALRSADSAASDAENERTADAGDGDTADAALRGGDAPNDAASSGADADLDAKSDALDAQPVLDATTFVCGSQNTLSCAAATQYCAMRRNNAGELPFPVNTCEALTPLPCFASGAGCTCSNLPSEVDASGCACVADDGSPGLTLDCY